MAERKSFILYTDYRQHLELLSDEDCGKLFIAIFDYAERKQQIQLTGASEMAFSFIKTQMDRDAAKYDSICKRNHENGAKGGRPQKPKKPSGLLGNPREPQKADNDNDTDNDTDITPIPPKGDIGVPEQKMNPYDERFKKFWKAYPKKKSKGYAEKAWKALKPDDELLGKILKSVETEKTNKEWLKDGGQYIPYPSTWLKAKGWEDEPDEAQGNNRFSNYVT